MICRLSIANQGIIVHFRSCFFEKSIDKATAMLYNKIEKQKGACAVEPKALPIIFSKGAKRAESFFFPTICNLLQSAEFLHYHDILELGVCLRGTGTYLSPSGCISFSAGDVQVVLPNQPHYNIAGGEGSLWTFVDVDLSHLCSPHISVDSDFLFSAISKASKRGIFQESRHPTIVALVKGIAALIRSDRATESPTVDQITAMLCVLLPELSRMETDPLANRDNQKREAILPAIRLASEAVEEGKHITPSELAAACFMSDSYFRKLFTSVMGESPKHHLSRLQTQKASVLLVTTDLSITEIAQQCGFEDNSTLYRRFTKIYGLAPSEYRLNFEGKTHI